MNDLEICDFIEQQEAVKLEHTNEISRQRAQFQQKRSLLEWRILQFEQQIAQLTENIATLEIENWSYQTTVKQIVELGEGWQRALAKDISTPDYLLTLLATNDDWHVREEVAKNASSSVYTLSVLARDKDPDVRNAVAAHSNASAEVLQAVAEASDSESPISGLLEAFF